MGKSSVAAAVLIAGFCPAANALQSAGPPPLVHHPTPSPLLREDSQKWWLIDEAKSLHTLAAHQGALNETTMEKLHEDWEGKVGKGFPLFSTRRVDFHKPAPAFEYMFPSSDFDHRTVLEPGIYEPFLAFHMGASLRACCKHGSGHFMDVGAQYGWYSLLSASYGCSVDAFEPVPWFQSLLAYNTVANRESGLADKVRLHPGKFVGGASGDRRTMVIPTDGKVPGPEGAKESQCDHGAVCVDVTETTVSEEMAYAAAPNSSAEFQSCGMRVNAQGNEPEVLRGAQSFISERLPKFVVIEVHPGMQKTVKRSNKPAEDMLDYVLGLGYVPHLLNWETVRTQNMNVAKGSLSSRKFSQPVAELVKKCGVNCIVYLERSW